jgi:hypothetical protein
VAECIRSLSPRDLFFPVLVAAVCGGTATAEQDGQGERAVSLERLLNVAEGYTITIGSGDGQRLELVKAPVLRYSDPVTSISDGIVLVWTKNGRPEAVMALHPGSKDRTWIEFQSLSLSPLYAASTEQPDWSPRNAGIVFKPMVGATQPEDGAPERLSQMRKMLRAFSASVSDDKNGRQELRLLSQPVFRYSQVDRGIIDGGIFAFVRATNPELLIVVEAQVIDGAARWCYSPARFTGRACELRLNDEPIWSHEVLTRPKDPSASYFQSY